MNIKKAQTVWKRFILPLSQKLRDVALKIKNKFYEIFGNALSNEPKVF